jgi:hypothetical protein
MELNLNGLPNDACHLLTLNSRSRIFYLQDGRNNVLQNVGSHKIYTEDGILQIQG